MIRPEYIKNNDDIIVQLNDWTTFDATVEEDDVSRLPGRAARGRTA